MCPPSPVTPRKRGSSSGKIPFARGEHMTFAPETSTSSRTARDALRAPYPSQMTNGSDARTRTHSSTTTSSHDGGPNEEKRVRVVSGALDV